MSEKKKLTVELDSDTHDRIIRHAEETKDTPEAAAARLIEQALRSLDSEPAKETGEDDPDNETSRRKERPPLPPAAARLTPLTPVERMELTAKIQNLYFAGRDNEARDLQKIMNQRERYEEKPTVEQQCQQLTTAIIKAGNSLVRP